MAAIDASVKRRRGVLAACCKIRNNEEQSSMRGPWGGHLGDKALTPLLILATKHLIRAAKACDAVHMVEIEIAFGST